MARRREDPINLCSSDGGDDSTAKKGTKVHLSKQALTNSTRAPSIEVEPRPKQPTSGSLKTTSIQRTERSSLQSDDVDRTRARDSPAVRIGQPEIPTKAMSLLSEAEGRKVNGGLSTSVAHGSRVGKTGKPTTNGLSSSASGKNSPFSANKLDGGPSEGSTIRPHGKDKPVSSTSATTRSDKDSASAPSESMPRVGTKRPRESDDLDGAVKRPRIRLLNGPKKPSPVNSSSGQLDDTSRTPPARAVPAKPNLRQSLTSQPTEPIDLTMITTPPKEYGGVVSLLSDDDEPPPPKKNSAAAKKGSLKAPAKQHGATALTTKGFGKSVSGGALVGVPQNRPVTPPRSQREIAETPSSLNKVPLGGDAKATAAAASKSPRKDSRNKPRKDEPKKKSAMEEETTANDFGKDIDQTTGDQLREGAGPVEVRQERGSKAGSAQAPQKPAPSVVRARDTTPESSQQRQSAQDQAEKTKNDLPQASRPGRAVQRETATREQPDQSGVAAAKQELLRPEDAEAQGSRGKKGKERAVSQENDSVARSSVQASLPAEEPTSAITSLSLSKQVERVLGKYLEELRGENEYWNKVNLQRARLSVEKHGRSRGEDSAGRQPNSVPAYSFASMKPIALVAVEKGVAVVKKAAVKVQIERMARPGVKASKYTLACPVTPFKTEDAMPSYAHFVSIKQNFLAPNVTTMHSWPYFSDDFNYSTTDGLKNHYTMDIEGREVKLLHLLQGQKLDEYVGSALDDLGISWTDILTFLLEAEPDVGSDADAQKALDVRKDSCDEEFTRRGERTALVLSTLPPSTSEKLAKAATLCVNFLTMTKFSLWHVARRHLFDTQPPKENNQSRDQLLNELTCRICLRLDCPYHGELKEDGEEDYDDDYSGSAVDSAIVTDIVHPLKVNDRERIKFPSDGKALPNSNEATSAGRNRSIAFWHSDKIIHKPEDRGPFYPCHHPGKSCEAAHCTCFEEKLPCEKMCSCPANCGRKFPGCTCDHRDKRRRGQRITCFEDDRCLCFSLSRECDPDLCGTCGVCEVLDPVNRYEDATKHKCHNASLQRSVPKRTLLGDSQVHGLGLYSGEDIAPHQFVGEYKGELVTREEADRRGAVYEHQHLSYLFALNTKQEIDSTYFGNKIRFINHASHGKNNLYPRVFLVNTIHRIALFAERSIKKGTELLFDYGPKFPQEQLGGKTSKNSAGRSGRGNKVIDEMWDVNFLKDRFGNTRAIKAAEPGQKSRPGKAAAARKTKGRARPGAAGNRSRKSAPEPYEDEEVEGLSGGEEMGEEGDHFDQSAGARLAAFNISDDGPEDLMDVDAGADEDFEPEDGVSAESEEDDDSGVTPADELTRSTRLRGRVGERRRRV